VGLTLPWRRPTRRRTDALRDALEHERESVERLESLDRRKNEFLGTVSHELRTPIASVLGYTEVLLDGSVGQLSDQQHRMLVKIDRNGRRLQGLIEDLLTLSQVVAGEFTVERAEVDLAAVVRRAVEATSGSIAERALELHVGLSRRPTWCAGDAAHLERVVVNLLTNALKFTPDGGRVALTLVPEGDDCVLTVADTGIGIAEEDLHQVFNSFFRSSAAYEQAVPGTGIGLAIAKSIVEHHEGSIEVDSRLGHGTSITVRIGALAPACA
jgi:signal transduction histidine kinase